MPEPCCTAIKPNGEPCAARPLPGRDCCLFHDPARRHALAESRRRGGATPRRRTRRYPRILDYKHVAELLGELFLDAINEPAGGDPQRLRALTGLANALLRAVGRPDDTYWYNSDRAEPAATDAHLLRIYPPEPPERACLLAAEAALEATVHHPDAPDPSEPSPPSPPSPPSDPSLAPEPRATSLPEPADNALSAEFDPRFRTPPEDIAAWRAAYYASPLSATPEPEAEQGWQQDDEQDTNRSGTGVSPTNPFSPNPAVTSPLEDGPESGPHPACRAEAMPPDPAIRTPSPSASVSPPETLSVPRVPILISTRRLPNPFG